MFSKMKVMALMTCLGLAGICHSDTNEMVSVTKLGDLPGNTIILMNGYDVMTKQGAAIARIDAAVSNKQDKLILDHTLEYVTVYKVTLDTEELEVMPKYKVLYVNGLSLIDSAFYNTEFDHLTADYKWNDTNNKVDLLGNVDTNDVQIGALDANGTFTLYDIESIQPINKKMLKVAENEVTTYQYSNPYDWRLTWTSLDEPLTGEVVAQTSKTNLCGSIFVTYSTTVTRNSQVKLSIQYFDEVNMPNFNIVEYEVLDGPATIDGDILTATDEGIVNIRAYASNNETRDTSVPMYTWLTGSSYTKYNEDVAGSARDTMNTWHANLLSTYRSNPTTNRYYTTWNSPNASKHYSNPGDYYTGDYGKQFSPYQHMGVSSGGDNGFWWAHGVVSKHVLLAAAHYGDYNFNRFIGGREYFNFDGEFSGKTSVVARTWYYLSDWAKEHGFEGTDAQTGDLAFWVVDGDIPNECLPYLATADWINSRYKVDSDGTSMIPGITLQQGNMISLKALELGGTCCSYMMAGPSLGKTYTTNWGSAIGGYSTSGFITSNGERASGSVTAYTSILRWDIYQHWAQGCWHDGILGDSGHPTFIFDPELTTGLTNSNGIVLYRPIITTVCTWASGGGTGLPRFMKVVKAFCAWVAEQKGITLAEEMPYVLGDPDNQSTDTDVIKNNAIRASGGTVSEE